MNYFEDLPINEDSLIEELKGQHMKFAHWGSTYAEAAKQAREAKIMFEKREAELRSKVRRELIAEGTRPTEGLLNERLNQMPVYVKERIELSNLELREDQAKNARDAMRMHKDVLLQLCYFLGQEATNTFEQLAKRVDGKRRKPSSRLPAMSTE